jgi:hypothetical protein
MLSVGSATSFANLAETSAAIPVSVGSVAFLPTREFTPTDEDLEPLGRASSRRITHASASGRL